MKWNQQLILRQDKKSFPKLYDLLDLLHLYPLGRKVNDGGKANISLTTVTGTGGRPLPDHVQEVESTDPTPRSRSSSSYREPTHSEDENGIDYNDPDDDWIEDPKPIPKKRVERPEEEDRYLQPSNRTTAMRTPVAATSISSFANSMGQGCQNMRIIKMTLK